MIEQVTREYLKTSLNLPAYFEKPDTKTEKYVTVSKISAKKENHISSCVIAIRSYASSLLEVAKLDEEVRNAMENMITITGITKVNLNTSFESSNTSTKEYRYQSNFELFYY